MPTDWYGRWVKPAFDRVFAAAVLLPLAPLLLALMLLIRLESPGSTLYRQRRVGRDERSFELLKLRTMTVDPDRLVSQTHGGSTGVTRVGRVLRRLKIDEMPQLWNVLVGDMSLVGPRPCLTSHLDEIEPWARVRFRVRPGLTGLAQVNGNVHLDWPERWRWDRIYVETLSPWTDLRVLARTALVLPFGEGRFRRVARGRDDGRSSG